MPITTPDLTRNRLPEVRRPDAGLVLISEWFVSTPERQRIAAEATMAGWEAFPWPEGLVSHSVFAAEGGKTVTHYSQWTSQEAVDAFRAIDRPHEARAGSRARMILDALPGAERLGVASYKLHHSSVWNDGIAPGCVVFVRFETDGLEAQQRLFAALAPDGVLPPAPPASLAAAHFHLGTDGRRAVVYSEWESAEDHRAWDQATAAPQRRQRIEALGACLRGFQRCRLLASLTRG
jgi:heme-degrading monooxygenase HmoA